MASGSVNDSESTANPSRNASLSSEQRFRERRQNNCGSSHQQQQRWKESLRRACLDRARSKRRQRLAERRRIPSSSEEDLPVRMLVEQELQQRGISIVAGSVVTNEDERSEMASSSENERLAEASPRDAEISSDHHMTFEVDEEAHGEPSLATEGASSPDGFEEEDSSRQLTRSDSMQTFGMNMDMGASEYAITEEELFEILEDVEAELRRDEEKMLEEVFESERMEEEYYQNLIAEEGW